MRYIAVLCLGCAVVGCGGGGGDEAADQQPANLRPAGSPDIVLLSVSGHDGAISAAFCLSDTNVPYLGEPGGAAESLADLFVALGFTIETEHFADRFDDADPDHLGFLQLLAILQGVFDNWMDGFDNPTRIVIVAHSHGATWAHIAASVMSHVPIDYLITLDGICFLWPCEHGVTVDDFVQQNGTPFPWDISQPCEVWPIAGRGDLYNTKDVAFDNVVVNLEVQSDGFVTFDNIDNFRLDGSRTGILTFFAAFEGHNDVREAGSDAMLWVRDQITAMEGAP